ncbi:MAG: hypothetical protein H5T70_08700, partial [Chloroflexi bacterium]|nr:hypothetical protein [Chloroflexota bacterium]
MYGRSNRVAPMGRALADPSFGGSRPCRDDWGVGGARALGQSACCRALHIADGSGPLSYTHGDAYAHPKPHGYGTPYRYPSAIAHAHSSPSDG